MMAELWAWADEPRLAYGVVRGQPQSEVEIVPGVKSYVQTWNDTMFN